MSRPSSPDSIDFAIQALGGNTETLELWKLPSKAVAASPQQRIAELEEEKNWLRLDINAECQKYKLLLALVPALRSQVDLLQRKVEEYDAEIQEERLGSEAPTRRRDNDSVMWKKESLSLGYGQPEKVTAEGATG
ncbi:hypothetical protein NQ176_g10879 [Zarea fungicola]|uniref:Uncharacterized protein n=1 Tax=Zarea fungicola TaxID=93591 RepID=A0ACC1MDG0_9HYPO|nr:hypothetical protein NQ176_g10879 [Lecanicillium fungicola]